jgi:hypothetical protein
MRILVLSDIHSRLEAAKKIVRTAGAGIDSLLLLGDLTNFGDKSATAIIGALGASKCHAIPGNLDSWEILDELEQMGVSLHGKSIKIGRFRLACFGGGLFGGPGRVLYSEETIGAAIGKLLGESKNAVLATHLPPKNTPIDEAYGGRHLGSKAVRRTIEAKQPLLHLCGHIHEASGETRVGNTPCINIGAAKEGRGLIMELGETISTKRIGVLVE